MNSTEEKEIYGEPIYTYTREMAIDDELLIDISTIAQSVGFKFNTAMTCAAYAHCESNEPQVYDEATNANIRELLIGLRMKIKTLKESTDRIYFEYAGVKMYSLCHPGDNMEPVITIMLIDED